MYDFINNIIGVSNLLILLTATYLLLTYFFYRKNYIKFKNSITENKLLIGSVLGIGAMVASLYYSEIVGFAPCNLCWIIRIGVYPTTIFFVYSFITKKTGFESFAKLILWPSLGFSLLHNFLYYTGTTSAFCDSAVSCTEKYIDIFGFLSIPLMGLIVVASLLYLVHQKKY